MSDEEDEDDSLMISEILQRFRKDEMVHKYVWNIYVITIYFDYVPKFINKTKIINQKPGLGSSSYRLFKGELSSFSSFSGIISSEDDDDGLSSGLWAFVYWTRLVYIEYGIGFSSLLYY